MKKYILFYSIIFCAFFINNSFGQNNSKELFVCHQLEKMKLLEGDKTIILVSNNQSQLTINGGASIGLFPKGDSKIALMLNEKISGEIIITIKDVNGNEFQKTLNTNDINCNSVPLNLTLKISSITIVSEESKATFNFLEYTNSAK